jgi:GTP-binding protein
VLSAIRSIERAHVVVLMCDAQEGVAEQDAKILGLAEERSRAMIVALNKSDLLDKTSVKKAEERRARSSRSRRTCPDRHDVSAKTGAGMASSSETIDERARRLLLSRDRTGELNRFFEQVLDTRPPPTMGGRLRASTTSRRRASHRQRSSS